MAEFSVEWLQARLKRDDVSDVVAESMTGAGGLNCPMTRLMVTLKGGTTESFVYKRHDADKIGMSKMLGLAREALFYEAFASDERLQPMLPQVLHTKGDLSTGEKEIIMQDLSEGIQSGYFFGPGSPHNWDKDLLEKTRGLSARVSALDVAKVAAQAAGRLHGVFFRDASLSTHPWIRGAGWVSGEGEELWESYQAQCRNAWASVDFDAPGVAWDPFLRQCIDAAIARAKPANSGFQSFLAWMRKAPWSLVHGDFHPANCMLLEAIKEGSTDHRPLTSIQFRELVPNPLTKWKATAKP